MTRGKTTCRILKEIRRQIAEANDIEFVTSECRYQGECAGTCPKCEAEVRYLETRLAARQLAGKAVALAGISAAMFLTGCGSVGADDKETNVSDTVPPIETESADSVAVDSVEAFSITKKSQRIVRGEVIAEDTLKEIPIDDDRIYECVEEKPVFSGGDEYALIRYVQSHIRYPKRAKANSVEGRVVVQFVITKTGDIGEIKVVKGKDPDLDKEAVRIVRRLPKFTPAKMNGYPVNSWWTVPVDFQLKE